MQEIVINFSRPRECPVVELYLYCRGINDYQRFITLVDTGAAYSVIDYKSFIKTGFSGIPGFKRQIGGFGFGFQECDYTAISTKLETTELKAVGYYVADLSNTIYDVIIDMPFLKNFDFTFKFGIDSDYGGKLILQPRIKSSALVDLKNFNPNSSKFGIYSVEEYEENFLTKSTIILKKGTNI